MIWFFQVSQGAMTVWASDPYTKTAEWNSAFNKFIICTWSFVWCFKMCKRFRLRVASHSRTVWWIECCHLLEVFLTFEHLTTFEYSNIICYLDKPSWTARCLLICRQWWHQSIIQMLFVNFQHKAVLWCTGWKKCLYVVPKHKMYVLI